MLAHNRNDEGEASDSSGGVIVASRIKVSDITLPALPSVAGFPAWLNAVQDEVIGASDLDETMVYRWINTVDD